MGPGKDHLDQISVASQPEQYTRCVSGGGMGAGVTSCSNGSYDKHRMMNPRERRGVKASRLLVISSSQNSESSDELFVFRGTYESRF